MHNVFSGQVTKTGLENSQHLFCDHRRHHVGGVQHHGMLGLCSAVFPKLSHQTNMSKNMCNKTY